MTQDKGIQAFMEATSMNDENQAIIAMQIIVESMHTGTQGMMQDMYDGLADHGIENPSRVITDKMIRVYHKVAYLYK